MTETYVYVSVAMLSHRL